MGCSVWWMWLAPVLSLVSRLAAHIYFRLTIEGEVIPKAGPALLVANHPNSLMDPILVAAAARRRVRFLAKAPLFSDRRMGFVVHGSGAIPVYRRVDDAGAMGGNVDMFRSVFGALAGGAAVALFPEGISHNEPSLTKLKTGAARIALGTFETTGRPFPLIPVGLVFRRKDVFRSEALVLVGAAIPWDDLAHRGQEDREAVTELTGRIESAMKRVTVNLERWEDRPLVQCAEQVWAAEFGEVADSSGEVQRLGAAADLLARIRQSDDARLHQMIADVATHQRNLAALGLAPADLAADTRVRTALRWSIGRIYLVGLPGLVIAALGYLVFWPPYRATGVFVGRAATDEDQVSTWKLMIGIPLYALWIALLAGTAFAILGPLAATITLAGLPLVGMIGLWLRERWRGAWSDAKRFFLLRSNSEALERIRSDQSRLAENLKKMVEALGPQV